MQIPIILNKFKTCAILITRANNNNEKKKNSLKIIFIYINTQFEIMENKKWVFVIIHACYLKIYDLQ